MVTALGCFGGDFNIDNWLLLSFSYKVSDLLSDKSSGLSMRPHKTLTQSSCEGGSDLTKPVTHRASKGGVAPALTSFQSACSLVHSGPCIGLIWLAMTAAPP